MKLKYKDAIVLEDKIEVSEDLVHTCKDTDYCSCNTGCSCEHISMAIEEPEQFNWRKRFQNFTIASILVILGYILEKLLTGTAPFYLYLPTIIFLMSYLISSYEVFIKVIKNIRGEIFFDENFLMVIATLGAIFTGNFIEAIVVMLFYKLGEIIENFGIFKSKKSINSLLKNQPEIAHVKTIHNDEYFEDRKPIDVEPGEVIIVKPGEKVPLDGIMLSKSAMFNTSMITGESVPRRINKNDEILSGMINLNYLIEIKVMKTYENSTIARILYLVQHIQANKSKTEKFTKKFAKYYTPSVVLISIFLAILPPLFFPSESFSVWSYRAMIYLVISCPCALLISVPLTYFGGVGNASKHGILIKGTQHLETLVNLDTIVFDKTGTITKGNFRVTEIIPVNGLKKHDFIEILASAERFSNHPIASSIIEAYKVLEIKESFRIVNNFKEIPSLGITTIIDGKRLIAGNDKILHKFNINHHHDYCNIEGTIVHVGYGREYKGYLKISDELKNNLSENIHQLRELGIKNLVLLSGDEETIVKNLSEELQFDSYHAGLLPVDKVKHFQTIKKNFQQHVNERQKKKKKQKKNKKLHVAYVGDGINDVPVIALADVGFAMGGFGSDAAIEAADVVIMSDSIGKIGEIIQIARKTRKIIWQNIFLIFTIKGIFLILGAMGLTSMWGAVFADVGMALISIVNSRRVLNFTPRLN